MLSSNLEQYYKNIFDSFSEAVLVLDDKQRVLSANRSFYHTFKVNPDNTKGLLVYELGDRQWDIPSLRTFLSNILPEKKIFDNYEVEHSFQSIGERTILLNGREIFHGDIGKKIILLVISDITERKKMEKLLIDSEERFGRLFETTIDGILLMDKKDGKIVKSNPASERMFGYSSEEIEGRKLEKFISFKDIRDYQKIIDEINTEGFISFESLQVKTKKGQNLIADIFFADKAKVIQCNVRDVTEKKKLEHEKDRLLDLSYDLICIAGMNGYFKYLNPAWERTLGYTREELLSRPFLDFIHPDDHKKNDAEVEKLGRGEKTTDFDNRYIHKEGSIRTISWTATSIPDERQIYWIGRDITERKLVEEQIRDSEERYRHLVEYSNDWIWEVDNDGVYTYASPHVRNLLGYEPKEIVGMRPFDLMPPEEAKRVEQIFREIAEQKRSFRGLENVNLHKDGQPVILETNGVPIIDTMGNLTGYRGMDRDITERKKLEVQLRHAQKMETVGQFAGGLAHDFNNILAVIMNYGYILKNKLDNEEQKEMVGQILGSADKASRLISDLLAFSWKQVLETAPVNLNEIIKRVNEFISRIIGEHIEIKTILTEKVPIVMADNGQIEQVLMNLATNAQDAMPEGGALTIETEKIEMDDEYVRTHGYGKAGAYAVISMSDSGQGMDKDTREKIFEPFYTTKEVGKGTGLGLAMVYGIIKQHNGYINVYSEPDEGTTFRIYLPLTGEEAKEAVPSVPETITKRTETVLLAEDDEDLRGVTSQILEESGYTVIEAVDGEDAVEKYKENREKIDLLILDMVMPKKSGKTVYDEIRREHPEVKALFMSGYTSDVISKKVALGEGLALISKPFRPKEFLKKIREVVSK